jgi:uncharacterized membrane protein
MENKTLKWLRVTVWFAAGTLCFIGLAMVIRRILEMNGLSSSGGPMNGLDNGFKSYPWLTYIHIIPGALFVILGPVQFSTHLRNRYRQFHRWSGRVFIFSAYLIGITAFCIPFILGPIGGINEAAATIFFAIFFLIAVTRAWMYILSRNIRLHKEWMIRTFVIGLSVATIRPIVVLFFIFSKTSPAVFFGTAFWIGFTLHLILAEVWINYSRSKQQVNKLPVG